MQFVTMEQQHVEYSINGCADEVNMYCHVKGLMFVDFHSSKEHRDVRSK